MTDEIVLQVENLGKRFKLYSSAWGRIKEWVTFGLRSYHKDFWSLWNISFQVRRGGFLGVIGPNGAGKSTLLKVITGVLEPTEGSYHVDGKVLSLIELNGGMDDDLTGRENITRSAQLLGFPDGYVKKRMTQIAEFADLGDFFDRPLRFYSSGMRIRLAFSLFAFLECDVLILDEVLAVGDIFFKQKCYARLDELVAQKTAIVFVTHSTSLVRQYCDDVIVLNQGQIVYHGEADQAIQKYFQIQRGSQNITPDVESAYVEDDFLPPVASDSVSYQTSDLSTDWPTDVNFLNFPLPSITKTDNAELTHLTVCNAQRKMSQIYKQGETAYFYFEYRILSNMGMPVLWLNVANYSNLVIHGKSSLQHRTQVPLTLQAGDLLRIKQVMQLSIAPNRYIFNLHLFTMSPRDYAQLEFLSKDDMKEKLIPVLVIKQAGLIEVTPKYRNGITSLHNGLCDLPGSLQFQVIKGGIQKDSGN